MTPPNDSGRLRRRPMHKRTIECDGYLRDDGLWEVEARLVDTKPFGHQDHFRGELAAGAPVHDIALRLAVDDSMTVREAETTMRVTPYPTCVEVEPILSRLIGESIGRGWRELVRRKSAGDIGGDVSDGLLQAILTQRPPAGPPPVIRMVAPAEDDAVIGRRRVQHHAHPHAAMDADPGAADGVLERSLGNDGNGHDVIRTPDAHVFCCGAFAGRVADLRCERPGSIPNSLCLAMC